MSFIVKTTILFFLAVPIGTISHELGHALVSILAGHSTTIHYSSVTYAATDTSVESIQTSKDGLDNTEGMSPSFHLWFLLAGPLSTLCVSSIGILLLIKHKPLNADKSPRLIPIVLASFCSREVMIGASVTIRHLSTGIYGTSDEVLIAQILGLLPSLILAPLVLGGLFVCVWLVNLIPKSIRIRFIASSIVGIALGWFGWFNLIGPKVLP